MKSSSVLVLLSVLVITAGCGGGGISTGGVVSSGTSTLVSITLSPVNPTLSEGMSEQCYVTGNYSDGPQKIITTAATWNSSNPGVATIDSSTGVVTSVAIGTTTIAASYGGFSQSTTLTVTQAALVSIAVEPTLSSIPVGTTEQFTATGIFTNNTTTNLTTSVTWTSSTPEIAVVSNATGSNGLVTSLASGTTLIVARSGSISGSVTLTVSGGNATTVDNVLSITVNGSLCSPATSSSYINKPCVSVTVCTPGSTTACNTINDILLDTGSYGLRIFSQALTISLTQVLASNGGLLAECASFGDGSSVWGPVQLADVILGNEPAVRVPIQVIDSAFGTVPNACDTPDTLPSEAGFTGILGVGVFNEDCGPGCQSIVDNENYYSCSGSNSSSNCIGAAVALTDQVQNPVTSLPTDNNGVIVELPSVPQEGMSSANGNLVLGIGTQSNNAPSGVEAYETDDVGEISTEFPVPGSIYTSIIDSGSNGLFFPPSSASILPLCSSSNSGGWFCPLIVTNFSAVNSGASGSTSATVPFQIGNFNTLTSSDYNVFSDIGAELPNMFDWGLPFFFGRFVYAGIEGQASSLGTGPYFAY